MALWQPSTTPPEGRALIDLLTRLRGIHSRCGELPGSNVVSEIEQWADGWKTGRSPTSRHMTPQPRSDDPEDTTCPAYLPPTSRPPTSSPRTPSSSLSVPGPTSSTTASSTAPPGTPSTMRRRKESRTPLTRHLPSSPQQTGRPRPGSGSPPTPYRSRGSEYVLLGSAGHHVEALMHLSVARQGEGAMVRRLPTARTTATRLPPPATVH